MAIVTGDRYLEKLVKFVEEHAGPLIDGTVVLKLNPAGLHYVQSRLEALHELENLLSGAPIDYLRAYVSDLGDHRALEQLRRILRLLTSLKVVSVLPSPVRDPTPLSLLPFGRLRVLELRGCDLSTSAAKGLLELRHTLEKIICHNSTDALRHVFASRIAEIKRSPQWNRLSFVSCACNLLVLMDESLQLLPAVETLDLSRNKFAKVDNLRRCLKLKHLDLGFNHLRTVWPLSEVSCHIVEIVLRNNALTTLHGLENLKSLEGLDASYNIISNFSELEFLVGLPCLKNLWLEGNPLCCARWYRAQVFTYFRHLDALKLDDKEISKREFWKRQFILASRQRRPSSFGFYSPAKDDAEGDGSINRKRSKVSRLALIESKEDSIYVSSDQESPSCDNEIQSKEENLISDSEAEIVDLINRVEVMKKERSILWLREFKEWLDHENKGFVDGNTSGEATLHHLKETQLENQSREKHLGESSKCTLDSLKTSEDQRSAFVFESNNSSMEMSTGSYGGVALPGMGRMNLRPKKSDPHEGFSSETVQAENSHPDTFTIQRANNVVDNGSVSSLIAIDDMTGSHSSSVYLGSPPHYQKDILHRRHNFVEEILQLSAESYSMASSDSNTSSSEDDLYQSPNSVHEIDQSKNEEYLNLSTGERSSSNVLRDDEIHAGRENDRFLFDLHAEQNSWTPGFLDSNNNDFSVVSHDSKIAHFVNPEDDWLERRKGKKKPRRRVISLAEHVDDKRRASIRPNSNVGTCEIDVEDDQVKQIVDQDRLHAVIDKKQSLANGITAAFVTNVGSISDDFVEKYFNTHVADSRINETCKNYMCCDCVLEPDSLHREREVVLLLSSEDKLYILLMGVAFDGSGSILRLLGWHRIEDVQEVLVGLGLQVVRVCIKQGATYLFLTRSIEKSSQLLYILQVFGPCAKNDKCLLRSLEQVQVELFVKQICGGSKMSIFQYSMVLFRHNGNEEESWLSRSLFVSAEHVLVCIEDLKQFSSPSLDVSSLPYFSLDSCCTISDVSELVIEVRESRCVTLALEHVTTKFCPPSLHSRTATIDEKNAPSRTLSWKLKWFSEESLFNFVALLKAIHAGVAMSPLLVTFVP